MNKLFYTFCMVLLLHTTVTQGQIITVHESYHSAGIKVILPAGYDTDKTSETIVEYKKTSDRNWTTGFHLDRITAQAIDQFRGSLFGLTENTRYDVRITLVDSLPVFSSNTLSVFSFQTRQSPIFTPTRTIKWVSPTGTGNLYSETNPGNLKVLLLSGMVTCGTTIYCKDGVYTDFDMGFTIATNCTESTPIQIFAAPGANPVFDGSYPNSLTWTQSVADPKLYSALLPSGTDYTNMCHVNGQILYPYPTVTANTLMGNYNLVDLNFGADGFVRDGSTIWLKTAAGLNPNSETVKISRAFRWLTVYGNSNSVYLTIKGITLKNYGKSSLSGATTYTSMAADFRQINHVTFDNCHFQFNNADIRFSENCNYLLIQNCTFENNSGLYTHAMIKKSLDELLTIPSSRGRHKETGAVQIFNTKGLVLRNNNFNGVNSGVVSFNETGFIEEVDIYNNIFENNFDAIECDGFWSNLRAWNNEFISPMSAFSIAPPKIGPRYFYRNVVHHLKGRNNVQDDPYYIGCTPPTNYRMAGIGIKTNSGSVVGDSANIYFINNTFHSEDSLGFVFTLWDSEWKSIQFINNILFDKHKHVGYFHSLAQKPNFQMDWKYNNFYSANTTQPTMVAKEIHGQFNCISIQSINQLESQLNAISGSSRFSFTHSLSANPDFATTTKGGFELNATSTMINAGTPVVGFYDYNGSAPDLGAKESLETILSVNMEKNDVIRLYPHPNAGIFEVKMPMYLRNATVKIYTSHGVLIHQEYPLSGDTFTIKANLAHGLYLVAVSNTDENFVVKMIVE